MESTQHEMKAKNNTEASKVIISLSWKKIPLYILPKEAYFTHILLLIVCLGFASNMCENASYFYSVEYTLLNHQLGHSTFCMHEFHFVMIPPSIQSTKYVSVPQDGDTILTEKDSSKRTGFEPLSHTVWSREEQL